MQTIQKQKWVFFFPPATAAARAVREQCTAGMCGVSQRTPPARHLQIHVSSPGQERLAKPVRSFSPQNPIARTENALAKVFNKPVLRGQSGMLAFFWHNKSPSEALV